MKTSSRTPFLHYQARPVVTPYWRPGEDYLEQIMKALKGKIHDGDIIAISEKAISTASGSILDESTIRAGSLARFLAKYWMRILWGYLLGVVCRLRRSTIERCRTYPVEEGAKHKQLALQEAGLLQALLHGSEGGIDGSNLPYSYVSLPVENQERIAQQISQRIRSELRAEVTVMIVDTDKTFTCLSFHFAPRPFSTRGIKSNGGIFAYVLGRLFKLKMRATPVAISDYIMSAETALQVADVANRKRGYGAGRTVWEMAETFEVPLTEVTWEMLDEIEHKPVVIVRPRRKNT